MSRFPTDRWFPSSLTAAVAVAVWFLVIVALPRTGACSERTFVVTPAEVAAAIDDFNGRLLVESSGLPGRIKIFRGGTRFARVSCPSVTANPSRLISQFTVLDTAGRAASLAGTRRHRETVAAVLSQLGADTWQVPASSFSSTVPGWSSQALSVGPGFPFFQAQAFGKGGGEGLFAAGSPPAGRFRFVLDLSEAEASAQGAFSLVMALTSETMGPRRRKPKLTRCFFLMELVPADMEELGRRLEQAAVAGKPGQRLANLFAKTEVQIAAGKKDKARESLADLAGEVGRRMGAEIDADLAAGLIHQALRVMEAL